MAYSVESNTRTPITQLREALDKAERLIVQVDGASVATFLTLLDNIEQQITALEGTDSDIRSEESRWNGLLRRLNTRPDNIVRAAAVAGGMDKLRAEHSPADSFWWHLDKEVAQRRVRAVRSFITTIVTVAVLVVGGYWAIDYFFPPDPAAVLMVETNSSLDRLIAEQRWDEALALVQATRAQLPDNVELAVWEVVLNERLDDQAAAAAALAVAEQMLPDDPLQLLLYLGNNRLRAGDFEGAQAAADQALALEPNHAETYFLLGNIAEARGDISLAISYFDQTSQLAEGTNAQLVVIARVRMGTLLQNAGVSNNSPAATPIATP